MFKLLCYQRVFILSFEINVDKRILPMHCLLMFIFLSIKIVGYCVLEVSVLILQSGWMTRLFTIKMRNYQNLFFAFCVTVVSTKLQLQILISYCQVFHVCWVENDFDGKRKYYAIIGWTTVPVFFLFLRIQFFYNYPQL